MKLVMLFGYVTVPVLTTPVVLVQLLPEPAHWSIAWFVAFIQKT